VGHVLHAIDPAVEAKGPGLGYGVKKAAAGVAQHVELAAKASTASANAKTQALYVARWANNVVTWSDEIIALAQRIRTAPSAAEAAKLLPELTGLTEQLTTGIPPVGRFDLQGGLQQAQERMERLKSPK
jgi:predicted house-cleaning NTP pyrophosphatase (Maf/HAM1 superfamily)